MESNEGYPTTKEILYLLGMGTLMVASILMPGAGYIAKEMMSLKQEADWKKAKREWARFNPYALKRNVKRLREQKIVEIVSVGDQEVVKLTEKGRTKYLKFKLEEISLKERAWDGKWRIVIYDIAKFKKNQQSAFRNIIKRINMLQIQKSVYLTPFPCQEEIEYLREYFGISNEVILIRADRIENEAAYRRYFGL